MSEVKVVIELPGDGGNYEVIDDAISSTKGVPGMALEIGLRRGGGCKHMIDMMVASDQKRVLLAIDPYGNIDYVTKIGGPTTVVTKMDYTNKMRNECLINMYLYCLKNNINFIFFNLEDTEFMNRFADGIPVYEENKRMETQYAVIYFDGPHEVEPVMKEVEFFEPRAPKGAVFVFDDVTYYDHSVIDKFMLDRGWTNKLKTHHKWSYLKG